VSAETDFVSLMKATSAVTAIIGTGSAAKVRADRLEQDDALPGIVYIRTGTENATALDGTIVDSKATLEVQCWADTRAAADALAAAVSDAVEGAQQFVTGRAGAYDDEGDKACALVTVDWWE
jgi:siroheme synthase (precorrin-2 oxidase/ferrochelatase)